MQLKSLEVFIAVVKHGSFSEAAKDLYTVQSNVTSHIKKLEAELNVEILHRRNPITPTRAGLQLYEDAEKILNIHKNILENFGQNKVVQSFPLKIGSMQTTVAARLPALFQNLQKLEQDFPFSLSTDATPNLIEQVKSSKLDCAFIANNAPIDGLFNLHMWTEKLVLISSKNAPDQLSKQFLSDKKFIAVRQECSYKRNIDLLLSVNKLPEANILEIGSLDGVVSCVSLGLGLAILPLSYVQQSHFYHSIMLHELDDHIANADTYLIADLPAKWGSNMHYFFKHLALPQNSEGEKEHGVV